MVRIAALMTCHNRREKTLQCLKSLYSNLLPDGFQINVFLVDDGSNDGTSSAVSAVYPSVTIIKGNGELFWNGGMRLAWQKAAQYDYDAYLWLNDDTILLSNAVLSLLDAHEESLKMYGKQSIIVGTTIDPESGKINYGGYLKETTKKPICPSNKIQECDLMNGNIVLVPDQVFLKIGNLSSKFTHAMGDIEYSARAKKNDIPVILSAGFQGYCESHEHPAAWTNSKIPLAKRYKLLHEPKGLPPKEYMALVQAIRGWKWPIDMAKLYLRVLLPNFYGILSKIKMTKKKLDHTTIKGC